MEFGLWIKEQRGTKKIGSRELSKLIGKSSSYVSQIEKGRTVKQPSIKSATDIIRALGFGEELQKYLRMFGYLGDEQRFDEEVYEDKETMLMIESIADSLMHMEGKEIKAIYNLINKNKPVLIKVDEIRQFGASLNTNIPINALTEYVDFLHGKYKQKYSS